MDYWLINLIASRKLNILQLLASTHSLGNPVTLHQSLKTKRNKKQNKNKQNKNKNKNKKQNKKTKKKPKQNFTGFLSLKEVFLNFL